MATTFKFPAYPPLSTFPSPLPGHDKPSASASRRPRIAIPPKAASISSINGLFRSAPRPQPHAYAQSLDINMTFPASQDLLTSPIDPLTMPQPVVHAFSSRLTGTTTYIVLDPVTEEAAIINPVLDLDPLTNEIRTRSADRLLKFINEEGLTIKYILETTLHHDRISACRYLQLMLKHIGEGVIPQVCIGENSFCTCGDSDSPKETTAPAVQSPAPKPSFPKNPEAFDKLFSDGEHLHIGNMLATCTHLDDHAGATYRVSHSVFSSTTLTRSDGKDPLKGIINHPEPPPEKPSTVSSRQKPSIDEVLGSAEKLSLESSPTESSSSGSRNGSPVVERKPLQVSPMLAFYAEQVNTRGGRIPRKINVPVAQRPESWGTEQGPGVLGSANAGVGLVNGDGNVDGNGKGKEKERERRVSNAAPSPLRIPRKLGVIMC